MLIIAEKIEKIIGTLLSKTDINEISGANYAQTARKGNTTLIIVRPQIIEPPKKNPIREKQLLIHIIDTIKAEIIYKLFIRALIERIITKMGDR